MAVRINLLAKTLPDSLVRGMCCILLLGMSTAEVGPGPDRTSDGARLALELMHDLLGS